MKEISCNDLRTMEGQEGLILQGCGGNPKEWLDGINDMLTDEGILLNGSKFQEISRFQNAGVTCLLFPFEGVELDVGKLAMWRLRTHGAFGGTWLSDYVPNQLGGFLADEKGAMAGKEKPEAPMIGADGNVFNLIGIARQSLEKAGYADEAKEMQSRVLQSGSYEQALAIMQEYVEPVPVTQEQGMSL